MYYDCVMVNVESDSVICQEAKTSKGSEKEAKNRQRNTKRA